VVQYAHEAHVPFLKSLGCEPTLRRNTDGTPFVTDNSNVIYHCKFDGIKDAHALDRILKTRAGIVDPACSSAWPTSPCSPAIKTCSDWSDERHQPSENARPLSREAKPSAFQLR